MSTDFSTIPGTVHAIRAPSWPAFAALASSIIALTILLPGTGSLPFAAAGYVLGALITPFFTVIYRFGRRSVARNPFFIPRIGMERLVFATLTLGILAGIGNAWFVATELAKQ